MDKKTIAKNTFNPVGRYNYNLLDLTKFFLSFAVISIHCDIPANLFISKFVFLSVPFFFTFSGFLIYNKTEVEGEGYMRKYIQKCFWMFIAWSLIYLPLTILGGIEDHKDFYHSFIIIVRSKLFTGQNYMSWPLWYLHSLLICSIAIYYIMKKGLSMYAMLAIASVFYFLGCLLDYLHNNESSIYIISKLVEIYYKVALSTSLLQSMIYIIAGMFIAKYLNIFVKYRVCFLLVGAAIATFLHGELPFVQCIATSLMSIFVLGQNIAFDLPYKWLRKMSTAIYFLHMYFIALEKYYVDTFYSDFYSRYIFAAVTTFLFSALLLYTCKRYNYLNNLL